MHTVIFASLGFPVWLRVSHFINLLFLGLLVRSGIQVLAAHPRLYWNDNCTPGSDWLKFTRRKVPKDRLYTSMDDERSISPWLGLPGRDYLGLGRHWHFFSVIFWLLNGIVYVVLLFATGEWTRLIPTSWLIVPRAWDTLLTYLTLHIPSASDFRPYDPLQQLTYAAVVFLLAPLLLLTGAAMSPAIAGRFPWYIRLFGGRQVARSLHFLGMLAFVLFTIMHTVLVLIVHFQNNIRSIVLGDENGSLALAIAIALIALAFVALVYVGATWFTLRHRRGMQHALGTVVDNVRGALLHRNTSHQHYSRKDISPYFWVNGRPPEDEAYNQLVKRNFDGWRLKVGGLVRNPSSVSLENLREMRKQTQITKHNCIQGWSGIAEWGGVPLSSILDLCEPCEEARYLVFTSLGHDEQGRPYYEVIDLELARHPQTLLAYEMNGQPLPVEHGAPLRLRVETQLGFKMVKYLSSIELVASYAEIGEGQGGYREDTMYYSMGAEV